MSVRVRDALTATGVGVMVFGWTVLVAFSAPRAFLVAMLVVLYVLGAVATWGWLMFCGELDERDGGDMTRHPRYWSKLLWAATLAGWPEVIMIVVARDALAEWRWRKAERDE